MRRGAGGTQAAAPGGKNFLAKSAEQAYVMDASKRR
jgi:hypothetical protein